MARAMPLPFTEVEVLLGNGGDLLLVLPHQVGDVAHGHRQEGPGGHGTEGERRGGAQQDTAVAGHDGTGHGRDDDIGAAGEETLAGLGRRGQRGDGVGESVLDVEGPGQEVVEAVLGGEGVFVEKKTGVSDLSRQDICGSRGRGGRWRRLGRSRRKGLRGFRDIGREVIIDRFPLHES
ncbi:hypothetical protein APSETT444_004379 [Aspergillus pseudonomiae]